MTEPAAPDLVKSPNRRWQPNVPWADELAERAMAMWQAGLSARDIGRAIGRTRNAVMGKVHRMGLRRGEQQGDVSRAPAAPAPIHQLATRRYKQKKREPWAGVVEIKPEMTPTAVGIAELEHHHCRWPVSGEGAAMRYCGGNALNGFSYCARHARMAYAAPRPKAPRP